MKHNIIKTENYLLVVDDSEIKEGDWIYESDSNSVNIAGKGYHNFTQSDAKITAHLPLNNSPILSNIDLLPPLEDEVDKLSADYTEEWCSKRRVDVYIHDAFKAGYNKAKEKYQKDNEIYKNAYLKLLEFIKNKLDINSNL